MFPEIKSIILNEFERVKTEIQSLALTLTEEKELDDDDNNFIKGISQVILFSISTLVYRLDYYSIIMNCLIKQMNANVMQFLTFDSKFWDGRDREKNIYLLQLYGKLSRQFITLFYSRTSDYPFNRFNSFGRFILSNLSIAISLSKGFSFKHFISKGANDYIIIKRPKQLQLLNFKDYIFKYYDSKRQLPGHLVKIFRLYFTIRLVSWKNSAVVLTTAKKNEEICRICEEKTPITDYILHIYYCKEQKMYYNRLKGIAADLKLNIDKLKMINLFISNHKKIPNTMSSPERKDKSNKCNSGFKEKKNSKKRSLFAKVENDFMKQLIDDLYTEQRLPFNYYEKHPEQIIRLFALMRDCGGVIIKNKHLNPEKSEYNKMNVVFSKIISSLLFKAACVQHILTLYPCKTKTNLHNKRFRFKSIDDNDNDTDRDKNYFNNNSISNNESENEIANTKIGSSCNFLKKTSAQFRELLNLFKNQTSIHTKARRVSLNICKRSRFRNKESSNNSNREMSPPSKNEIDKCPSTLVSYMNNNSNSYNDSCGSDDNNDSSDILNNDEDDDHILFNRKDNCDNKLNSPNTDNAKGLSFAFKPLKQEDQKNYSNTSTTDSDKRNKFKAQVAQKKININYYQNIYLNKISTYKGSLKVKRNLETKDNEEERESKENVSDDDGEIIIYPVTDSQSQESSIKPKEVLSNKEINSIINTYTHNNNSADEEVSIVKVLDKEDTSTISVMNKIAINDFTLMMPIAKGGYGKVEIYKKNTTGDLYAIKSVDIQSMKIQNLGSTIIKEAQILNEIDYENIVKCYYIFTDNKYYYYAMEYLPGGDLHSLINAVILPFKVIVILYNSLY